MENKTKKDIYEQLNTGIIFVNPENDLERKINAFKCLTNEEQIKVIEEVQLTTQER